MPDAMDYGKGLRLSMYLFEGDFVRRDIFTDYGKISKGGTWAEEVKKGDLVVIYTGSDWTVRKASSQGANPKGTALGQVVTTPEGGMPVVSADGGTASWATSSSRLATVELLNGHMVRQLIIKEAPGAGVLVSYDGGGTFSTASVTVSTQSAMGILLESASSGSTKSVLLF